MSRRPSRTGAPRPRAPRRWMLDGAAATSSSSSASGGPRPKSCQVLEQRQRDHPPFYRVGGVAHRLPVVALLQLEAAGLPALLQRDDCRAADPHEGVEHDLARVRVEADEAADHLQLERADVLLVAILTG